MSNLKDTYGKQWSDDPAMLKNLLDAGHTVIGFDLNLNPLILLSCDDEYWFETNEDRYPIKHRLAGWQFLLPAPSVEPAPLEWHHYEDGSALSSSGDWSFYADDGGDWNIKYKAILMEGGCTHDRWIESPMQAIHEWRVNHLNSMIKK